MTKPVRKMLALSRAQAANPLSGVDRRVVTLCGLALVVGLCAGVIAQLLSALIAFFTNLSFYGRLSTAAASPWDHALGAWVIVVPVVGGLVVGVMARFGSKAIRGHGIPEAMENVLVNQSRIPGRIVILKPLSAAVAIGSGGPFGAEGPIIATGAALGSLLGQWLPTSANERKTLLAAGAAAGMAATFGSPVSAVLLAVELLLFEYRPRSLLPVALAATAATAVRIAKYGAEPVFALPDVAQPGGEALAFYVVLGGFLGLASIVATRAVYAVEDAFARLPIHWMWWPALGGVCVGLVGYLQPRTLGVGYSNIEDILGGHLSLGFVAVLCSAKFVSWVFALGSGTSGGTLAPLFTFGSGIGALLGSAAAMALPSLGVDPRIAALVGMAALFAGASRALLASVVFAFETTRQPIGLLPLLGGCSAAFLTSSLLMKHSIMTEKIARRGVRVSGEYTVDPLEQMGVRDFAARGVVCLQGADSVRAVKDWLLSDAPGSRHQGFPVLDAEGSLRGVVTRAEVLGIGADHDAELLQAVLHHPAITVDEDCSLRQAADTMAREGIGRLPVVRRELPRHVIAIITRSDLIGAHVL